MDCLIKLEQFEGPLDLLCHLIDKNEMDLYDIPIAAITKQYMSYIYSAQEMNLEVASEFLVMAATLIDIKSRMLLPVIVEEGDGLGWEDPRTDLVERILEYKRYKEASEYLRLLEEQYGNRFFKSPEDLESSDFKDPEPLQLEVDLLQEALLRVFEKMDRVDTHRETYFKTLRRDPFTVEEKMNHVRSLLQSRKSISFSELVTTYTEKLEVITTFLALLELLKEGTIGVIQPTLSGPIELTWKAGSHS